MKNLISVTPLPHFMHSAILIFEVKKIKSYNRILKLNKFPLQFFFNCLTFTNFTFNGNYGTVKYLISNN